MHPSPAHLTVVLAAGALLLSSGCGGNEGCDLFDGVECLDGASMLADVERLASPEYQGRRAGTPENAEVVDFVASRFAEAKLEPVAGAHRQPFQFEDWIPGAAAPSVTLGGRSLGIGADFEPLWFSGTGAVTDVEVVFVGYGLTVPPFDPAEYPDCPVAPSGYDAFADVDLTGKAALVFRGLPDDDPTLLACPRDPRCNEDLPCWGRQYQFRKVQEAGAAALIQAVPYWSEDGIAPFAAGAFDTTVPAVLVARSPLEAALPELPTWAAQLDTERRPASRATGVRASISVDGERRVLRAENVLGVVPGADPALRDEIVVVGAHLDHMGPVPYRDAFYPGADDNASGTAVLLELARAVAESPTPPARTLLFAAWNAEELGLIGSCVHVLYDPAFPIEDTVAAFSVDMVGAGTPGLELWGGTDHPELVAAAETGAQDLGLEWPILSKEPLFASDHYCYAWSGVPAFLASTPEILDHPYYHSTQDTPNTVSRENLEAAAALVWASVRPLAEGVAGGRGDAALRARTLPPAEQWLDAWHGEARRVMTPGGR